MDDDFIDPNHVGRDSRIIEQAVRHGWEIPDEALRKIPQKLLDIAIANDTEPRDVVAVARVLVTMKASNERRREPKRRRARPQQLPQQQPQPMVMIFEGGVDEAKRGIVDRLAGIRERVASRIGANPESGGNPGDQPAAD